MNFNIMEWLRKYKNTVLIGVVGAFVVSMFVGFGLYLRSGSAIAETVLEVNGDKIPYRQYSALYNRIVNNHRDKNEDLSPEALNQIKNEVIQSLIQESVFYQESQRYGIEVTDAELAQNLASIPAFQKDGKFSIQSYAQALRYALHSTPEDFEESQRKQIAIARLRAFVMQGIKITDHELEEEYAMQLPSSKKAKTPEEMAKEKEAFRQKLRQEKGSQVLARWYQQLGSNLKIKSHLEEIERRGMR